MALNQPKSNIGSLRRGVSYHHWKSPLVIATRTSGLLSTVSNGKSTPEFRRSRHESSYWPINEFKRRRYCRDLAFINSYSHSYRLPLPLTEMSLGLQQFFHFAVVFRGSKPAAGTTAGLTLPGLFSQLCVTSERHWSLDELQTRIWGRYFNDEIYQIYICVFGEKRTEIENDVYILLYRSDLQGSTKNRPIFWPFQKWIFQNIHRSKTSAIPCFCDVDEILWEVHDDFSENETLKTCQNVQTNTEIRPDFFVTE